MSSPVIVIASIVRRRRAPMLLAVVALIAAACADAAPAPPEIHASPTSAVASLPAPAAVALDADGLPVLADVPVYKADAARTGVMNGPGPIGAVVEAWRTNLECAINEHTPVIADGLVLIGCDSPVFVALDARTGDTRWTAPLDGAVEFAAGVDGALVYVGDAGGSLRALDLATGAERWSVDVDPFRYPGVVDGTLYVGTTVGTVLGLDPSNGSVRWTWQAPEGVRQVASTVVGDTLYAGADDGHLYAVSLADGSVRWTHRLPSGRVSSPSVSGDTVFVSALQNGAGRAGGLFALDAATGDVRWSAESPSGEQVAPPVVADGVVYAPSRSDGLFAFDAATGSPVWRVPDIGHIGGQAPAIAGNAIYLAADRSLAAFDRRDGRELWSFDLGADVDNGAVVSGGLAFVGDNAGNVVALGEPSLVDHLATRAPSPTPSASATPPASLPAPLAVVDQWGPDAIGAARTAGVDVGPDGLVYVVGSDTSEIIVIDPADGQVVRRWGTPGAAKGEFDFLRDNGDDVGGVAVAPNGTVYVADALNRRIQVFDAKGSVVRTWGRFGSEDGQFLEPTDVALAPNGDVYVVDDRRDDIQRFTSEGKFLSTIGRHGSGDGELNNTGNIDVDAAGTLYLADWTNHRVEAWDDAGTFLWTLGTHGFAPGELSSPADVAVDGAGRIWVHDYDNERIQVFDADRTYLGEVPVKDAYLLAEAGGDVFVTGLQVLHLRSELP
jgi:outer membrane protein assembly factor BamB